jgi:integrase
VHKLVRQLADGSVRITIRSWRGEGSTVLWSTTADSRAQAEAAVRAAAHEIAAAFVAASRPRPRDTVAAIVGAYRASPEWDRLAAATKAGWKRWLARIEEDLGDIPLRDMAGPLGRRLARTWRDGWRHSPREADMAAQVLGRVWRWAQGADLAPHGRPPTDGLERLYIPARADRWWRDGDLARLRRHLNPSLALIVDGAIQTGLRLSDLTRLSWTDVIDDSALIRARTGKSRRRQVVAIPIDAELARTLEACPKIATTVFTSPSGRPWTPANLKLAFQRAKAAAGITGLTFHDLRGTAAIRLAAAGLSTREIARRLGWSEREAEALAPTYIDDEAVAVLKRARKGNSE